MDDQNVEHFFEAYFYVDKMGNGSDGGMIAEL